MKIAIDFDGTCVEHKFPDVGKDAPGAVDCLKKMVNCGHKIILNTMRSGEYLEAAVQWFIQRDIPLSGINSDPRQSSWTQSPKVYADIYIDDAAFGCPLITPPGFNRACVDWSAVDDHFFGVKTAAEKEMVVS